MTVRAAEILGNVRARLDNPLRWTQGGAARDACGSITIHDDPRARCWCVVGAIQACSETGETAARIEAARALVAALNETGTLSVPVDSPCDVISGELIAWNDDQRRTHDDVLAALDAALIRVAAP